MSRCEGLAGQVFYPVTELIVTRHDKAAIFTVNGVTDSVQIDYLNLENSVQNNYRANVSRSRCSHCRGSHPGAKFFKQHRNKIEYKKLHYNKHKSNNMYIERNSGRPTTCFRCVSEDHFIANLPKPETSDEKVHWNTKDPKTRAYRSTKTDNISENISDKINSNKIYAYMTCMSTNAENLRRNYGDSLKLNNLISDSGATF